MHSEEQARNLLSLNDLTQGPISLLSDPLAPAKPIGSLRYDQDCKALWFHLRLER